MANSDLIKFNFTKVKAPYQIVIPIENIGKLVLFPNGKCRLMGLKHPINDKIHIPFKLFDLQIQSITVTHNVGYQINLLKLARYMPYRDRVYEPELFPALRLTRFNPICVNVFSNGKIVILGLKQFTYQSFLRSVDDELRVYKERCVAI
jgi:TATA-box binding protein (TBP) (component of TFIID and TFIIIB)